MEDNTLDQWLKERLLEYNELITESNKEYESGVISKESWTSAMLYWQHRIYCDKEVYNQRKSAGRTDTPVSFIYNGQCVYGK
jgi:hypothetical protein